MSVFSVFDHTYIHKFGVSKIFLIFETSPYALHLFDQNSKNSNFGE